MTFSTSPSAVPLRSTPLRLGLRVSAWAVHAMWTQRSPWERMMRSGATSRNMDSSWPSRHLGTGWCKQKDQNLLFCGPYRSIPLCEWSFWMFFSRVSVVQWIWNGLKASPCPIQRHCKWQDPGTFASQTPTSHTLIVLCLAERNFHWIPGMSSKIGIGTSTARLQSTVKIKWFSR